MSTDRITTTMRAGVFLRRQARVALDLAGVDWREYKSWTESTFVVTGTAEQIERAQQELRRRIHAKEPAASARGTTGS